MPAGGGYPVRGATVASVVDTWGEHLDNLARWGRSDWPLAPDGRAVAGALALGLGLRLGAPGSGNGRGALGEVVRLLLATAQADVATLRAALADPRASSSRALLAGVLGAPWLLAAVRARGGAVLGTELRACASREEAAAVLTALSGADGVHGPLPALRALVTGWVRGPRRDAPLLGDDRRDAAAVGADDEHLLVLPLLALEGTIPMDPPAAVLAGVLGAAQPRAGSPFLVTTDVAADERATEDEQDAEEDDDRDDDRDDREDADAADGAPRDDESDEGDAENALPSGRSAGARVDVTAASPAATAEPEPVEPQAMAAALERLRARRQAPARVDATVASDDGVVEHVADVTEWLASASAAELRALAAEGWAGEEAIEVARALAAEDPEVAEVVRHARRTEGELVVEIDGRAAGAWLRANRPTLADALDDLLD